MRDEISTMEPASRNVLDALPALYQTLDTDCRIIWVSPFWLGKLGYERKHVIGRSFLDFLADESAVRFDSNFRAALSGTAPLDDLRLTLVCSDGSAIEVLAVGSFIDDEEARAVILLKNVSALVKMEHCLKSKRDRLEAIIDGTGAGTWEWNVQTGQTIFNHRWAEIVGYTLEELTPTTIETWLSMCHPDDLAQSNAALEHHFAGDTPLYEMEVRMRHKTGRWVWVRDTGKVRTWTEDGKPEWMYGTHICIDGQKTRERALLTSEELLERTGRLAGVGGWELDLVRNEVLWTDETCRIHGVEPGYKPTLEEGISFYAPEARPIISGAVARGIAAGESWDLELPFCPRDGRQIWVRAVGEVTFEGGKPVRMNGTFQDITMAPSRT